MTGADWWAATWRQACRSVPAVTMSTVIGPIALWAPAAAIDRLEWPSDAVGEFDPGMPTFSIAVTSAVPPEAAIGELHRAGVVLDREGRGDFPLTYRAGEIWWAQWKNGPAVARQGNDLLLYAAQGTGRWLNRLLRELLIHGGSKHGFRLGHGAVVSDGSSGLLLCGASGVGKTDAVLKVAAATGRPVVSVDRILLGERQGALAASPLPFGLNIHLGTLRDLGIDVDVILRNHRPVGEKVYLPTRLAERLFGPLSAGGIVDQIVELRPPVPGHDRGVVPWPVSAPRLVLATSPAGDPAYRVDWLGLRDANWNAAGRRTLRATYRPGTAAGQSLVSGLVAMLDSKDKEVLDVTG